MTKLCERCGGILDALEIRGKVCNDCPSQPVKRHLKLSINDHIDSMLQSAAMWRQFALHEYRILRIGGMNTEELARTIDDFVRHTAYARECILKARRARLANGDYAAKYGNQALVDMRLGRYLP